MNHVRSLIDGNGDTWDLSGPAGGGHFYEVVAVRVRDGMRRVVELPPNWPDANWDEMSLAFTPRADS